MKIILAWFFMGLKAKIRYRFMMLALLLARAIAEKMQVAGMLG